MNNRAIKFKLWGTRNKTSIIEIDTNLFSALINNFIVVDEVEFQKLTKQLNVNAKNIFFIVKENGSTK